MLYLQMFISEYTWKHPGHNSWYYLTFIVHVRAFIQSDPFAARRIKIRLFVERVQSSIFYMGCDAQAEFKNRVVNA